MYCIEHANTLCSFLYSKLTSIRSRIHLSSGAVEWALSCFAKSYLTRHVHGGRLCWCALSSLEVYSL